jgi:hypothetical protein
MGKKMGYIRTGAPSTIDSTQLEHSKTMQAAQYWLQLVEPSSTPTQDRMTLPFWSPFYNRPEAPRELTTAPESIEEELLNIYQLRKQQSDHLNTLIDDKFKYRNDRKMAELDGDWTRYAYVGTNLRQIEDEIEEVNRNMASLTVRFDRVATRSARVRRNAGPDSDEPLVIVVRPSRTQRKRIAGRK